MTTRYVNFYGNEKGQYQQTPYICGQEPIEYFCDGKDGRIHFDGYYYVEDHAPPYSEEDPINASRRHDTWLPQKLIMFTQLVEKEPYKVEVVDNVTRSHYKDLENHQYIVEIYKRVIHEKTDVISTVEDEDGDEMNVCFFPTNRQTIYFRVLGDFVSDC